MSTSTYDQFNKHLLSIGISLCSYVNSCACERFLRYRCIDSRHHFGSWVMFPDTYFAPDLDPYSPQPSISLSKLLSREFLSAHWLSLLDTLQRQDGPDLFQPRPSRIRTSFTLRQPCALILPVSMRSSALYYSYLALRLGHKPTLRQCRYGSSIS